MDLSRRPVELVRAGARVALVGGTARHLRGAARAPRDLHLAFEPAALDSLVEALGSLGVEVDCRLPAPMARRLRTWDAGDGSGLRALEDLLDR